MSPPGVLLDSFCHDTLADDGAILDDVPAGKVKMPLREQYKVLNSTAVNIGAKIDWVPSWTVYRERVARRLKQGLPAAALPQEFPKHVAGPACWSAADVNPIELVRTLSEAQVAEIEDALAHFKGLMLT